MSQHRLTKLKLSVRYVLTAVLTLFLNHTETPFFLRMFVDMSLAVECRGNKMQPHFVKLCFDRCFFFSQGHKHVWQRGLVLLCLFVWWPPFSVLLPESRVHTEIKSWRLALSDWFLFVFCMVWSYLIFLLAFIRQPAETSCQE